MYPWSHVPKEIKEQLLHLAAREFYTVCLEFLAHLGINTVGQGADALGAAVIDVFLEPCAAVFDEHTADEHGFRHRPLAGAEGLEALTGFRGEAV